MGKITIIVAKVYKKFVYPKSSLSKTDTFNHARNMACADYDIGSKELLSNNEHVDSHLLEVDIVEEKGFSFKGTINKTDKLISVEKASSILAERGFEKNYGLLNHESSPEFYYSELDHNKEQQWYLKDTYENAYLNKYHEYFGVLSNNN